MKDFSEREVAFMPVIAAVSEKNIYINLLCCSTFEKAGLIMRFDGQVGQVIVPKNGEEGSLRLWMNNKPENTEFFMNKAKKAIADYLDYLREVGEL